jgi:hypothetical protein
VDDPFVVEPLPPFPVVEPLLLVPEFLLLLFVPLLLVVDPEFLEFVPVVVFPDFVFVESPVFDESLLVVVEPVE